MSIEELPPRESMEFDVVIVGAGPSGLSAAIRLKQLNADLSIVVVEKGSEVGAHILSGAVIDPVSLDKLIPDWREDADCPLKTQVKDDRFYWFTATGAINLESDESHWILRPSGYVTVNFRGRFAGGRHRIVGRVEGPACSTFTMSRVEEAPQAPRQCFLELPSVSLPSSQAWMRRR